MCVSPDDGDGDGVRSMRLMLLLLVPTTALLVLLFALTSIWERDPGVIPGCGWVWVGGRDGWAMCSNLLGFLLVSVEK